MWVQAEFEQYKKPILVLNQTKGLCRAAPFSHRKREWSKTKIWWRELSSAMAFQHLHFDKAVFNTMPQLKSK